MLHNNSSDLPDAPHPLSGDEFSPTSPPSSGNPSVDATLSAPPNPLMGKGAPSSTTRPKEAEGPPVVLRGTVVGDAGRPHSLSDVVQDRRPSSDKRMPEEGRKPVSGGQFAPSGDDHPATGVVRTSAAGLLLGAGRYVGELDLNTQLPHGRGMLHFSEGGTHNGVWRNGKAHGYGERSYANGDLYLGEWVDGVRCGSGEFIYAEGHRFKGTYANNEPNGYGVFVAVNNDRYAGRWLNGCKDGKGQEVLHDGQRFVGRWRNGKKQGRGRLYLPGIASPIYGVWNNDEFFRELTSAEVKGELQANTDDFGGPQTGDEDPFFQNTVFNPDFREGGAFRQATEPDEAFELGNLGSRVAAGLMGGLSFIEDRLEALGRAFEHVATLSPFNTEESETRLPSRGHFVEMTSQEGPESYVSPLQRAGNASTLRVQEGVVDQSQRIPEATEIVEIEDPTYDEVVGGELEPTHDALYQVSLNDKEPLNIESS
ncbi:unnamed protein product [Phytomonas sp. EM1]|nr:unnamed protein product [Phytomonas sp. EM1]|eukprot:CCW59828.1 unnamed protein product [Phytomonas sp. isolate EM1]